jgi:phage tail sheath protein FI
LSRTDRTAIVLNTKNLDDLYTAKINPIATFNNAQSGGASTIAVYGQKTLQKAESALDRVNVRRLLIEIRRQVRAVANTLLFEPNREDTLARFQNAVTPILARIQSAQGLDRFRVQIDASTTTQADIENNTIRGKIFLQPTKTTEFISLTFEVGNSIA